MTSSPGYLIAERMNLPVVNTSLWGRPMSGSLITDEQIKDAKIAVFMDAFYWYKDCAEAIDDANHLLDIRAGKPMFLATIPWRHGCAEMVNRILEERCKGECKLVHLEGDLTPPELHPDAAYFRKIADTYADR